MAANDGEKTGDDLYSVLGLKKECSTTELRSAYKKLALFVEEAKKKFQDIQQAYSVLSDTNKRFLYDVGVYDSDDDQNGMGDFLSEMATMMSQTKPSENAEESFEQLQELFHEMFQGDIGAFESPFQPSSSCSVPSFRSACGFGFDLNDQHSSQTSSGKMRMDDPFGFGSFEPRAHNFSLGVEHQSDFKKGKAGKCSGRSSSGGGSGGARKNGRKHKVSSSSNCGIST